MRAVKEARKLIEQDPRRVSSKILARLVLALESDALFPVSDLYALDRQRFELALQILAEWRLDRYYAGKARLFDLSYQVAAQLAESPEAPATLQEK